MSLAALADKSKWIKFELQGPSKSGKTLWWRVETKVGTPLGLVLWYAPWRCYCYEPAESTIYEKDCLRDIAEFCEAATTEHKARRASA